MAARAGAQEPVVRWEELRHRARETALRARAPYSGLQVGAAGLTDDGQVLVGCNVENASFGLTLCAECGLASALGASGARRLVAVSVVDATGRHLAPCGRCRQILAEVGGRDLLVDGPGGPRSLEALLPDAFGAEALPSKGASGSKRPNAAPLAPLERSAIAAMPKVMLHDHLDGGLRPETALELAEACGWAELPTTDAAALARWFGAGAQRGSLLEYLEGFRHTVALLQRPDSLSRVARECVEDLAADGVVYAEVRYAPELSGAGGLGLDETVEAILAGFAEGRSATGTEVRLIVSAMRNAGRSVEVAELAARWASAGVVGFDLAGPEEGYPASAHLAACEVAWRHGVHLTLHAGEGAGLESIRDALHPCGAERLGHGVRIAEDVHTGPDGVRRLGPLAAWVRDRQVPLELCPSSNVHTGAVESHEVHPAALLAELGFAVTISTDNRLMSGVTLTDELWGLVERFGWGWPELVRVTETALDGAFVSVDERRRIRDERLVPGFAALGIA
jgi:adenosine deaminase